MRHLKILLLILFASFFVATVYAQEEDMAKKEKRIGELTTEELDKVIREIAKSKMANQEKMIYYSGRFLGTPYVLLCEGDGTYARYDTLPLMNLKEINCMTYCEIVMALTLSSYYEEMFNVLQHIRYKNGIIGMATRNHYTMTDWLPENSWCLDDVTVLIGGNKCKRLTRTISHKKFFEGKGITDIMDVLPDRESTINYIPKESLLSVTDKMNSGDVVSLIQDAPGILSAHMLMIYKDEKGKTYFRHASMSKKPTLDEPFDDYVSGLMDNKKYLGMAFMRIKENVQWVSDRKLTHGKVIE